MIPVSELLRNNGESIRHYRALCLRFRNFTVECHIQPSYVHMLSHEHTHGYRCAVGEIYFLKCLSPKGPKASKQAWPSAFWLWHLCDRSGASGLNLSERAPVHLVPSQHAYLQHCRLSNFMYNYIGKAEIYFCICLLPFYIFTLRVYGALPLRPGEVDA